MCQFIAQPLQSHLIAVKRNLTYHVHWFFQGVIYPYSIAVKQVLIYLNLANNQLHHRKEVTAHLPATSFFSCTHDATNTRASDCRCVKCELEVSQWMKKVFVELHKWEYSTIYCLKDPPQCFRLSEVPTLDDNK